MNEQIEIIKKLRETAKKTVLQFNESKKALERLKEVANKIGFLIDEETGEIILLVDGKLNFKPLDNEN